MDVGHLRMPGSSKYPAAEIWFSISCSTLLLIKTKTDQGWPGYFNQNTTVLHNNLILNQVAKAKFSIY